MIDVLIGLVVGLVAMFFVLVLLTAGVAWFNILRDEIRELKR